NADPDPFPARDGTIYISDINNHRVRRVGTDGIITTVAGTGFLGFSGDGGPARQARFFFPTDLAVARHGTGYIYDSVNNRIRKHSPYATITTIAGGGSSTDDNIPGLQAALNLSSGADMAIGSDGALYFSERNFHRIRRLSTDGILTTIAGNGTSGFSGDG